MTARLIPSTALAAAITFSLFWIMTALVHVPEIRETVPRDFPVVEWVEVRQPAPPIEKPPVTPIRTDPIPAPTLPAPTTGPGERAPILWRETPIPTPRNGRESLPGLTQANGDAIPLVRVAPTYPERALARGIEGRVLVEFSVDKSGNVKDARVLASEPPNVFDKAALRAVEQWRYNPRIENGRPVERTGLKIAIPFRTGDSAGH